MNIEDILTVDRTFSKVKASSRKKALEEVANLLSAKIPSFSSAELFSKLIAREKIGSTALGHGVAIPHCRMENCPSILGGLFTLEAPIDFESPDRSKTELLFVLVVPEEEVTEHLTVLSLLASRLDSESYRNSLFAAESPIELFNSAIASEVAREVPNAKQAQS